MATTFTQQRAVGKGLAAAVQRARERSETPLVLHHGLDGQQVAQLLRQIQSAMPMGVSLVAAPQTTAADLAQSQAQIDRLVAEKRALQQKCAAMQEALNTMDMMRGARPAETGEEWMTLSRAAKLLGKSYATLWRAKDDGRLTVKVIGGKARDHVLCLPSTFRGKR